MPQLLIRTTVNRVVSWHFRITYPTEADSPKVKNFVTQPDPNRPDPNQPDPTNGWIQPMSIFGSLHPPSQIRGFLLNCFFFIINSFCYYFVVTQPAIDYKLSHVC